VAGTTTDRRRGSVSWTRTSTYAKPSTRDSAASLKLYVAWPRLRDPNAAEAWARRTLVRANIDESRRPWRRERTSLDGHDEAAPALSSYEERSALVEVLQQLPAMQRKVVVLRHMVDLSVSETASELGISEGTVKSHSSRGLIALEKALLAAGQ
jgi:RNA polymerase sigma factor (sigma-70 family)